MRSQVRREGSCSCCWLLLCSCTAALPTLLLRHRGRLSWTATTVAIMFQTGGHAQCLWTAKGDMTLACCAWAIVPTPSLLQPRRSVSAFEQRRPGAVQAGARPT